MADQIKINKMNSIEYKILKNKSIKLKINKNVFKPTGTSTELLNAITKQKNFSGDILDLGCGSGYLSISLKKIFKKKINMYASDLSKNAIKCAQENADLNNLEIFVKTGSIFSPWRNKKFDIIVNDISGVSSYISSISNWFDGVPCNSGCDGTKLVTKVLKESKKYLKINGQIIFPVLSLSNTEKILNLSNKYFQNVKLLSSREWLIPSSIMKHKKLLHDLRDKKLINFKEKFGLYLWTTDVYLASSIK